MRRRPRTRSHGFRSVVVSSSSSSSSGVADDDEPLASDSESLLDQAIAAHAAHV